MFCNNGCTSFYWRGSYIFFFFKVCFTTSLTDINAFFSTFFKIRAAGRIGAAVKIGAAGRIGAAVRIGATVIIGASNTTYWTIGFWKTLGNYACTGFGTAGSGAGYD